jgi:opacity protein-like surface antigen
LAPCRLAGQDTPAHPERYRPTTAFPAAVGLMLSSGSYGDRAKLPRPVTGDEITYKLSSGLAVGAHVQFPVTRRLGLVGSASITRRNRRAERQGDPFASRVDKVRFSRLAAGVGFRFRPHAPVFFAGTFVYNVISPGPVEFQDANVAEVGGGVGVGYDFSVSRSPVFGRIEVWNYWVKPSGTDLNPGYEAKSRTHDLSVALSVNYRLTLPRARAGSGR